MNFDYILNPDKYHAAPPRLDGEKDEQYKLRLQAYSMGMQSQQAKIGCMQVRLDGANERALSILNHKNVMVDKMQAEIDELQGRIDELKITQNNLELKAEDAECVSMSLDDQGVEKCDDDGKSYSLWGRVCQFKKSNNITERDELQARIDGALEKCYIGIRKQGGDHYLELVEDILKGNKDEN